MHFLTLSVSLFSLIYAACGNTSHHCLDFCSLCHVFYGKPTMGCLSDLLTEICFARFNRSMELLNSTNWCTWSNVNG